MVVLPNRLRAAGVRSVATVELADMFVGHAAKTMGTAKEQ